MRKFSWLGALVLLCVCSAGAFATEAVVSDAIKLSNAKVSDEVIVAWADTQRGSGALSADAIVELKNANVSEKVITALVKSSGMAGGVRELQRYEVPAANVPNNVTDKYVSAPVNTDSLVQYTYAQPARTVYVDSSPTYTYASYPYYSSSYYSGYPYYGSYYYPRYYGSYYGSYCYPRSSFSIGFGGWGGSHWGGSWGHSGGSWHGGHHH